MTICYFTASGNCLYVARRLGGTLLSIPQLMRQDKIEIQDDAVGIVSPVYAVEMPAMVRKFIAKVHIQTDYFFFVYTYGMGYAEAFAHVKLATEDKGLKLSYINAIQMVDNYLPIFDQQEQIDTLPQKNVEGQIERLLADIAARKTVEVNVTAETLATIEMYKKQLAVPILRKETAKEYIVNDNCISCGICAKVCPANNINVTKENGVQFADRCEVCYACLHNCPQNALHLKKEANTVKFRNEHVTLKDIIEANQ
ncbi:MAG: EFR1 family ferrodoxin [Bacteroidales bacterium]|nr:EFR1 family ferrodoxin [Bacteroidales bacterium]